MSAMGTGIDPKEDYVFKRLCGDEDNALVLVDLLNAVLDFPPGRVVRGVLLLNPFVDKDYAEGKVPVLDVRARDDPGRQFLLEMQRVVPSSFTKRLLYYWAGAHAEQLLRGERYETLQPTYVICFLAETLFDDGAYHHTFRVGDAAHGTLLSQDLEMHLLELSKFAMPVEAVQTALERWCYFFKHGASLDLATLPATLDVPAIRKAVEVLMKISQDEIERHRAAERLKGERDAADRLATAKLVSRQEGIGEGIQIGREQGVAQGIEKGTWIGRIQLLQELLRQAVMSNEELTLLTDEALLLLEESLQRQLGGKQNGNGASPAEQT
jgi:predicted transposase/invertase (TIGR01784 family)